MEDIIKQIEEKRNIYNENNRNWYHQRKLEGRNIKIKKPEDKQKPGPKPKPKEPKELKPRGRKPKVITEDDILEKYKFCQRRTTKGRPPKIKGEETEPQEQ